jgi:hypothetical protein
MAAKKVTAPPSALHFLLKLTTRPNRVCESLRPFATKCHTRGTSMNKSQRGRLHEAINDLRSQDLAGIVKQSFHGPKAARSINSRRPLSPRLTVKYRHGYHVRRGKHKHRKQQSRTGERGLTVRLIFLPGGWRFVRDRHPDVKRCSQILPRHVRDYIPHAIRRAREVQRGPGAGDEVRPTAHSWLVDLRVFFSDLCAWATEPGSPFKRFAPRTIPATRHTFLGYGFGKARERTRARITATVLDLEREMPKIRAFALQRWRTALAAPKVATTRGYLWSDEIDTFWDWALLELLVQSGLRIEEASELTTLDILKRKMPDGRIYYLLHIKPSKFDRARVIPIGDGLGRVLAEIIRYVKRFYDSESVPVCDHGDLQEKRPRPPAPYLIQGIRHPSIAGIQTIRSRIREISIDAGARRSNGSPLVLLLSTLSSPSSSILSSALTSFIMFDTQTPGQMLAGQPQAQPQVGRQHSARHAPRSRSIHTTARTATTAAARAPTAAAVRGSTAPRYREGGHVSVWAATRREWRANQTTSRRCVQKLIIHRYLHGAGW